MGDSGHREAVELRERRDQLLVREGQRLRDDLAAAVVADLVIGLGFGFGFGLGLGFGFGLGLGSGLGLGLGLEPW